MVMVKGLMGRCLHHETTLGRLRDKAKMTEEELLELKTWRVAQEKKFKMLETDRNELFKPTEEMRVIIQEKEQEVRLAKETAVQEFRDSDALLSELGDSFNEGFDEAIRQVKVLYPNFDVSSVNVNAQEITSTRPADSENTDELFEENPPVNAPEDQPIPQNDPKDGESARADQQTVESGYKASKINREEEKEKPI